MPSDCPSLSVFERDAAHELRDRLLPQARLLLEVMKPLAELRPAVQAWLEYWWRNSSRDLEGIHITRMPDGNWQAWVVLSDPCELLPAGPASPSQHEAVADAIDVLAVALMAQEEDPEAAARDHAVMQVGELRFALSNAARDTGASLARLLGVADASGAEVTAHRYIAHKFPDGISRSAYEKLSEEDRTLFHGVLALCLSFGLQFISARIGAPAPAGLHGLH
jgi:hypothetical protein